MANANPVTLPVIAIDEPCPASWDDMTGDARERFCTHCNRHVHDLSEMTSGEVADLLCRSAGNLCARFERAADGAVKTLDYQSKGEPSPARWKQWLATGVMAGVAATVGSAVAMPALRPMGAIRVRIPVPTTPAAGAPASGASSPTCAQDEAHG
jgi:hypothetical protein